jgi:hypothetical protein
MKKFLFLSLLMIISLTATAQTVNLKLPTINANVVKPKIPNTTIDSQGNFHEKVDVKTNKIYTSAEGKIFDVYQDKKGKYYIITGISEKTGKPKKKYLVI